MASWPKAASEAGSVVVSEAQGFGVYCSASSGYLGFRV